MIFKLLKRLIERLIDGSEKNPNLCVDCKHFAGNSLPNERPSNALHRDCIHPKSIRFTIDVVDGTETTYCPSAYDQRNNRSICGIKAKLFEAKL